jgi:hypothetical protein
VLFLAWHLGVVKTPLDWLLAQISGAAAALIDSKSLPIQIMALRLRSPIGCASRFRDLTSTVALSAVVDRPMFDIQLVLRELEACPRWPDVSLPAKTLSPLWMPYYCPPGSESSSCMTWSASCRLQAAGEPDQYSGAMLELA